MRAPTRESQGVGASKPKDQRRSLKLLKQTEKKNLTRTFLMMGSTASVLSLDEEEAAAARPFGRCESGTRMGLCRRMARFF